MDIAKIIKNRLFWINSIKLTICGWKLQEQFLVSFETHRILVFSFLTICWQNTVENVLQWHIYTIFCKNAKFILHPNWQLFTSTFCFSKCLIVTVRNGGLTEVNSKITKVTCNFKEFNEYIVTLKPYELLPNDGKIRRWDFVIDAPGETENDSFVT